MKRLAPNQRLIYVRSSDFKFHIFYIKLSVLWVRFPALPLILSVKKCFQSHILKNEIKKKCYLELRLANLSFQTLRKMEIILYLDLPLRISIGVR